jgi:uncharacterized protein YqjF (DUF2071 family)
LTTITVSPSRRARSNPGDAGRGPLWGDEIYSIRSYQKLPRIFIAFTEKKQAKGFVDPGSCGERPERCHRAAMSRFMRHDSWDDALFVHYPVDGDLLQERLPPGLLVDRLDGVAYVGVVCLRESGIVPWPVGLPLRLVKWLSLSHNAVNVRTYVRSEHGPSGIYFFTLECDGALPTFGASALFNLPYRLARMRRWQEPTSVHHQESSRLADSRAGVQAAWRPSKQGNAGGIGIGDFVVERYALYNPAGWLVRWLTRGRTTLWHGSITHAPWPLVQAELLAWDGERMLAATGLDDIVTGPPVAHASSGVGPISFFWNGSPPAKPLKRWEKILASGAAAAVTDMLPPQLCSRPCASDLRRIWVVGASGVGKSTFAMALAARLGLVWIDLDELYWLPGWESRGASEMCSLLAQRLSGAEGWVVSGNYISSVTSTMLEHGTTALIWVRPPVTTQLLQLLWRTFVTRWLLGGTCCNGNRESLWTTCFSSNSIFYMAWKQSRSADAKVLAVVEQLGASVGVSLLRSRQDAERFVEGLACAAAKP